MVCLPQIGRGVSTLSLAAVAHELKTPLSSITDYVDRLLLHQEKVGSLHEWQQCYSEPAQSRPRHLKALIDNLPDMSRSESGSLVVAPEIEDVVRSLQHLIDKNGLPSVKADRLRLYQILNKVLSKCTIGTMEFPGPASYPSSASSTFFRQPRIHVLRMPLE